MLPISPSVESTSIQSKIETTKRLPTQRVVLTAIVIDDSERAPSQESNSVPSSTPKRVSLHHPNVNTSSPKVIPNFNANCAVPSTSNFYNRQIADTYARLNEVFPNEATEEHRNQLWNIAETAYRLADEMYSIKEANIWADNFEISGNIVNNDEALFHASTRDLTSMVQTRKENFHRSD